MKEHLNFQPIKDHPELVSESVYKATVDFPGIFVGEIDPKYMKGVDLAEHYDVNLEDGANCIIVQGKSQGVVRTAAVVIPVGYHADLNGLVCEKLNVKRVSMAPLDEVIQETGMEYGSITPVGLPESWKILVDSRIMEKETIIVGGGRQVSKLRVPTEFFRGLSNVEVVEDLANKV